MKILLTYPFDCFAPGGAAQAARTLLEGLASHGHNCMLVAPIGSASTAAQFLHDLRARGLAVTSFTGDVICFQAEGVEVHALVAPDLISYVAQQIARFKPGWIIPVEDAALIHTAAQARQGRIIAGFAGAQAVSAAPELLQNAAGVLALDGAASPADFTPDADGRFFALPSGCDPLTATQEFIAFLSRLSPEKVKGALAEKLTPEQRARLALQLSKKKALQPAADEQKIPCAPRSQKERLPLSFAQQRLWFLAQLVPDSPFYNVPTLWQLNNALDLLALQETLNEIVRRHEVLRTTFPVEGGEPYQQIQPPAPVPLEFIDLSDVPGEAQDASIAQVVNQDAAEPFDLAAGPLLRARLFRLGTDRHVLLINFHHIIFDGWSTGVLMREFVTLYRAFADRQPSPLPELTIQYADFAYWQRQMLQGERLDEHLRYWKKQLDGAPELLSLPTDYPRPEIQTFQGAYEEAALPAALTEGLKTLSDRYNTTLFMTIMAAFNVLLYRYTHQENIVIGSGIANRNYREIEDLIGFFVNALPVHSDLSGNPTFLQVLERVRKVAIDVFHHQDLPFEKLVEELQPERKLSHAPVFQVSFVYQNFPDLFPGDETPFVTLYSNPVAGRTSKFDLTLYLLDGREKKFVVEYNSDLFKPETIRRMLAHFQTLLEAILADPNDQITHYSLLSPQEHQALLVDFNNTQSPYPSDTTLHQWFEAQAAHTPEALALIWGEQQVTYGMLNRRSNQLAHYLRGLGVGPEALVGVCLERSVDMVVAMLGILKAGGAYLPLDPEAPADRLAFMLTDSQVRVLISQQALSERLQSDARLICIDADWPTIAAQAETNPAPLAGASSLAYMIYTSGSTGQPKGTLLEHRGACNLVHAQRKAFAVQPHSRVFQFASASFDASVSEIFVTLLSGAALVLPTPGLRIPSQEMADLLRRHKVTTMTCTPSVWAAMPEIALPDLETVITAGEDCPAEVVERWSPAPGRAVRRLINAYGPTEATVCATLDSNVRPGEKASIGAPIDNVQVYVLDASLQPVLVGVTGELYISGAGLARGYWQRPKLTAERFLPNPFAPGARMYRTGDLARFRYKTDGTLVIDFLGRADQQMKLRGFRIELGEIETVLRRLPVVREAVVSPYLADGASQVDQQLAAYLVLNKEELRNLETELPELNLEGEQVTQWQGLFEDSYSRFTHSADPTFNVAGWNSSYTGLPIPEPEMREWVENTVARMLAVRPKRVLELGCGTGLLLFRAAPHTDLYWGCDFSESALAYIRRTIAETHLYLPQVKLTAQRADDFTGIPARSFDLVVINSVAQYFPTAEYLVDVLEKAVEAVRPGGCVFIGDVRSLPLLEAYHASIQLHKAPPTLPVTELNEIVRQRVSEEEELTVAPAFFSALRRHLPRISRVETHVKRGQALNELTKFRYDVYLHVEATDAPAAPLTRLDWQSDRLTVEKLEEALLASRGTLLVCSVPNSRVQPDLQALELIATLRGDQSAGELRERIRSTGREGQHPETFWTLAEQLGCHLSVTVSRADPGCYDLLFRRSPETCWPMDAAVEEDPRPWHTYANNSLQRITSLRFVPYLRRLLEQWLPSYMIPSAFVILDQFPLNNSGKIDRRALPAPGRSRTAANPAGFVIPRDPLELQLSHIWEDVLKVYPVGVTDNFFELGGHSLLAVALMARIKERFDADLPLSILFQQPTIEQLAATLREKVGFVSTTALVPIQPRGSRPPFFCVHPAGGNVICYTDLARCLGADQPFYGLQDPGLATEQAPFASIEEMADHYLAALRAKQPKGPYRLGGWSFGAYVALEMAHRLLAAGEEVTHLAIFDTVAPRIEKGELAPIDDAALTAVVLQQVARNFGVTMELPAEAPKEFDSAQTKTYILECFEQGGVSQEQAEHLVQYAQRYVRVYRRNMTAETQYITRPYPGPVALFRAQDVDAQDLASTPAYAEARYGWERIAPHLEVYPVPGTHHTILYEPFVQVVAERLRTCLEASGSMLPVQHQQQRGEQ